jgi:hypothetical protein
MDDSSQAPRGWRREQSRLISEDKTARPRRSFSIVMFMA